MQHRRDFSSNCHACHFLKHSNGFLQPMGILRSDPTALQAMSGESCQGPLCSYSLIPPCQCKSNPTTVCTVTIFIKLLVSLGLDCDTDLTLTCREGCIRILPSAQIMGKKGRTALNVKWLVFISTTVRSKGAISQT